MLHPGLPAPRHWLYLYEIYLCTRYATHKPSWVSRPLLPFDTVLYWEHQIDMNLDIRHIWLPGIAVMYQHILFTCHNLISYFHLWFTLAKYIVCGVCGLRSPSFDDGWLSGVAVACQRCRASGRGRSPDSPQGDNPGQQLYHARAEQLGELGLPGCDEALSGMGGASLTNEVAGVM